MLSASLILHKRSSVSGKVPALTSLELGELAINTTDGKIFTKSPTNTVYTFLNSSAAPYILNQSLSSINVQYGNNSSVGTYSSVLNGSNNIVVGSKSTIANGENNNVFSNFGFIANGSNNTISLTASRGAILGGSDNNLKHANSFILGSNISSHAENFTYVNNLSVEGKIYGDGNVSTIVNENSATWNVIGDRYFTTSTSSNSINKGTKVFQVSADLSYIPTQDVTVVYDHDIDRHMHGTVLDYNSSTGSLTADITSHAGSGTYSDWRINIGGTPSFANFLTTTNDVDIEITDPTKGLILRSPNNTRWRITVNNNGTLAVNSL